MKTLMVVVMILLSVLTLTRILWTTIELPVPAPITKSLTSFPPKLARAPSTLRVALVPKPQTRPPPPFPPHTCELLPDNPEIAQVEINWSNLPIYVLNGRKDYRDIFAQALTKHGLNYTLVHPNPEDQHVDNWSSWMNSVTKGHATVLGQAFFQPSIQDVLVLEDDALLVNYERFEYAVKTYFYHERSFYSLQDTNSTCTRYHYGMVAYLMNRRFYDEMKTTCLINYSRPIDDCLLSLNRLAKVQFNIFQHGLVVSSKVTLEAKLADPDKPDKYN